MPVTYRFDSNIVVIEMVDEYSMDDIRTTVLNSLADSVCPANPFILMNLSKSRSIYIVGRQKMSKPWHAHSHRWAIISVIVSL